MSALLYPAGSTPPPLGKREQLIGDTSARGRARQHLAEHECILEGHARALSHVGRSRVCSVSDEHDPRCHIGIRGQLFDWCEVDGLGVHETIEDRAYRRGEIRKQRRNAAMSLSAALSGRSQVRSA
jgi:hypothetical protein